VLLCLGLDQQLALLTLPPVSMKSIVIYGFAYTDWNDKNIG